MNTENNSGKGIAIAFSIFMIAILFSTFTFYNKWKAEKQKYESEKVKTRLLSESISNMDNTARIYKVKLNDTVSVMAAEINELNFSKNNINKILGDKVNELKAVKVKNNELNTFVSVRSKTKDSIISKVYIDSLQDLSTEYQDSFINIKATIFRNKTANIKYECYEDFDLFVSRKPTKHFLFFKWKYRNNYLLLPKNPKTWVKGLKVYTFTY